MSNLNKLIRPDLRDFNAYSSARAEAEAKPGEIWLNANESPYPFTLDGELYLNRYPEKQPPQLIKLIASMFKVKEQQIALSLGSDNGIDLITRLFCQTGTDSIMICPPTFPMYAVCARLQGAKVIEVPLIKETDYQLDVVSILKNFNSSVKIIFLCSPNNPTGNLLKRDDILFLCEKFKDQCIIAVDEAYIEFADAESLATVIDQYENLVVLRTFSKAYGLAAVRCGMILAAEEIIKWILKITMPYPIPALTLKIIFQVLSSNQKQIEQQINAIKAEKIRVMNALKTMSCIKKIWPSDTNFLLAQAHNSRELVNQCAKHGIVIREMNQPGLENCVRITMGLPKENDQLIATIRDMN